MANKWNLKVTENDSEVIALLKDTEMSGKEISDLTGMPYHRVSALGRMYRSLTSRKSIGILARKVTTEAREEVQETIQEVKEAVQSVSLLNNRLAFRSEGDVGSIKNSMNELKLLLEAIEGMSSNANVTLVLKVNR